MSPVFCSFDWASKTLVQALLHSQKGLCWALFARQENYCLVRYEIGPHFMLSDLLYHSSLRVGEDKKAGKGTLHRDSDSPPCSVKNVACASVTWPGSKQPLGSCFGHRMLLNIQGTPIFQNHACPSTTPFPHGAVVTVQDGYRLTKRGQDLYAQPALSRK